MRKSNRAVSELADILAIMQQCEVCNLALMDGEYPYVLPLNFGFSEKNGAVALYFHGAQEGKKLTLASANPHAAFAMDCKRSLRCNDAACTATMDFESVCGKGVLSIVENSEEKLTALRLLMEHYFPTHTFEYSPQIALAVCVMRLDVSEMTGKRHEP